jgi:hypothetical protein
VVSPNERLELLFEELAKLAGPRNAIDGRIVEIVAEIDRTRSGALPAHARYSIGGGQNRREASCANCKREVRPSFV